MKIVKTFRIDKNFSEKIKTFCDSSGITFSQFVELACYAMADEEYQPTKQVKKIRDCKHNQIIKVPFCIEKNTFNKLLDITEKKGCSLSQEIRFRLSATLTNPMFSEQEFSKLAQTRSDLNRLGNLLKLTLDTGKNINDSLINELINKLDEMNNAWLDMLLDIRQRQL